MNLDDRATFAVDFSAISSADQASEIGLLCDAMEAAAGEERYPRLVVERPWSLHNPRLEGEFASLGAIRWYLERELSRLAADGARVSVYRGREAVDLHDPRLALAIDETQWDLRRKKLFLFAPERMALSMDRLQHYTGTRAELFQRYVLLTNYAWHVEEFRAALPGCVGPDSDGRQMPAWHHVLPGHTGVTMVNIGVGASNAKTLTDHLAVLRPDLMLMIGHCAGLRNHQEIGDLVLATAYMRDDRVLDDMLPLSVPVTSSHTLNSLLLGELTDRGLRGRMGIVFTTANRNWELNLAMVENQLRASRALAVDMESATVAANGFRYRIPTATLLAVSDKPLHAHVRDPEGQPAVSGRPARRGPAFARRATARRRHSRNQSASRRMLMLEVPAASRYRCFCDGHRNEINAGRRRAMDRARPVNRTIDYHDDPVAPEPNTLVPAVSVVVTRDNGAILLICRTDNGTWALPGAIEMSESVRQAAIRATREETGIDCEITGVAGIYSDPGHVIHATSDDEVRREFSIVLTARPVAGQLTPSAESSEVRWVRPWDLDGYTMDRSMRQRVDDYVRQPGAPVIA